MKKNKKKILLTGGHAGTTALAVVDVLINKNVEITWIGAKSAFEKHSVDTIENIAFQKSNVKIIKLDSAKINWKSPHKSIPSFLKIPTAFIKSIIYIKQINPDVVLSFGGFITVPVVMASKIFGKKIIIHEQTTSAGKANQTMSRFADLVALSRESSRKYFNNNKIVVTGNPINKRISKIPIKTKLPNKPKILVIGGSRGSSTINTLVTEIIDDLLLDFEVDHITGQFEYEKYKKLAEKRSLSKNVYKIYSVLSPDRLCKLYKKSDIVISRAGANVLSELLIIKRPAILIPIPWSYNNEQFKNAKTLEDIGLALVLDQNKCTGFDLLMSVKNVRQNWSKMVKLSYGYKSPDLGAAERLSKLVLEYTQ